MSELYISLGTNIDRDQNLQSGLRSLSYLFDTIELSSLYECDPVGFSGDKFYNMVIKAQTTQSLTWCAEQLRQIEMDHGRPENAKKFSSRTLDLDILLFDNIITNEPVQIPRSEITENAFVLWPLAELAGELKHPSMELSYTQLWQQFDCSCQVIRKVPFTWPI